jgi:hypothetical protein
MRQALNPDQAEDITLVFRKIFDRLEDPAGVGTQGRASALGHRHQPLVNLNSARLFI